MRMALFEFVTYAVNYLQQTDTSKPRHINK